MQAKKTLKSLKIRKKLTEDCQHRYYFLNIQYFTFKYLFLWFIQIIIKCSRFVEGNMPANQSIPQEGLKNLYFQGQRPLYKSLMWLSLSVIESLIESPKSLEIAKKIMSISHTIHLIYYQYYSHSNNNKSTVSEDSFIQRTRKDYPMNIISSSITIQWTSSALLSSICS